MKKAEPVEKYKCDCGKSFPSSQAKAGHCHFCVVHQNMKAAKEGLLSKRTRDTVNDHQLPTIAVNGYQNSFQDHDKFYGNDFAYRENQGQITKKPRLQTLQNLYKHSQGQEGRTVPSFIPPMPMQPPQLQVPYYYQQPQPLAKEVSYRMAQEGTGNPTSFQSDQKSLFIGQAQPFQQMQIPGQMPEQGQSEQSLHFFPPQKIYIPENQQFPLEHKDDQQNQQQQFISQQQFGLQLPQKIPQPTERTTQPPIEQPCPMMGDQKSTILLDSPSIEAFNSPLIASKSVDLSSESENLRDAFSPETIALSEDVEKLAEKTEKEKEKELQTVNDSIWRTRYNTVFNDYEKNLKQNSELKEQILALKAKLTELQQSKETQKPGTSETK